MLQPRFYLLVSKSIERESEKKDAHTSLLLVSSHPPPPLVLSLSPRLVFCMLVPEHVQIIVHELLQEICPKKKEEDSGSKLSANLSSPQD